MDSQDQPKMNGLDSRPLVIELYAGSFGWGAGFVAEGWRSIGFDILHEPYHGPVPEHCELVLEDVLNIHGSRFKDAQTIVGSSPCQEFSYRAMPWKRAKALGPPLKGIELFEAQFRIQREACAAAGRYIPMVVENVKGVQPWVGRAKAHFGSYFLWGDVESIGNRIVRSGLVEFGMPSLAAAGRMKRNPDGTDHPQGSWFKIADSKNRGAQKNNGGSWFNQAHNTELGQNPVNGEKTAGLIQQRDGHGHTRHLTNQSEHDAVKVEGISFSGYGQPGYKAQGFNVTAAQRYREENGTKGYEGGLGRGHGRDPASRHSSRSDSRKAASAAIAKIPFELARHIARTFYPIEEGSTLRK